MNNVATPARYGSLVALLLLGTCACAPLDQVLPVDVRPVLPSAGEPFSLDEGYYQDAVRALNERDYGRALEYLQAAREKQNNDIRVLNAFGVVYDKLGRFDLSARYYAEARALDPVSPIVQRNLAYSAALQRIVEGDALSRPIAEAEASLNNSPPIFTRPPFAPPDNVRPVQMSETTMAPVAVTGPLPPVTMAVESAEDQTRLTLSDPVPESAQSLQTAQMKISPAAVSGPPPSVAAVAEASQDIIPPALNRAPLPAPDNAQPLKLAEPTISPAVASVPLPVIAEPEAPKDITPPVLNPPQLPAPNNALSLKLPQAPAETRAALQMITEEEPLRSSALSHPPLATPADFHALAPSQEKTVGGARNPSTPTHKQSVRDASMPSHLVLLAPGMKPFAWPTKAKAAVALKADKPETTARSNSVAVLTGHPLIVNQEVLASWLRVDSPDILTR